jgi:translation initiation factor IF-2
MDNTDNKPKKLGLKLKGSVDTANLAKDYINLNTNTNQEAKNTSAFASAKAEAEQNRQKLTGLTNSEVSKRLDVLQKAKELEQQMIVAHVTAQQTEVAKNLAQEELVPPIAEETKPDVASQQEDPQKAAQIATVTPEDLKVGPKPLEKDLKDAKIFDEVVPKAVLKAKVEVPKKLKKHDIYNLLENEGEAGGRRGKRRDNKGKNNRHSHIEKVIREVEIYGPLTVTELASKMSERVVDVVKELMKLGMMADGNKLLDLETAELLAGIFGHDFKKIEEVTVSSILAGEVDDPDDMSPRPPVVTVMGHVDHGKTSLLDAIKFTDVALRESGGITQNIGAYQVTLSGGRKITFLDTPGHGAFTQMRKRGSQVTDIVILVVAADDGINDQTVEAINHAKAAELPIIVAVNKIDKLDDYSNAVTKIKNEMLMHNLIAEDMGGDVIFVPVSALKKINLDKLEEAIILLSDLMELKGNYKAAASGVVLDSMLDKHRGAFSTLLVTRGVLRLGDFVVAGSTYGKVRTMQNDKGNNLTQAELSTPAQVFGLEKISQAGDKFTVTSSEKQAREIAKSYSDAFRENDLASIQAIQNLLDPFAKGQQKELLLLIKTDSQGTMEAIIGSLAKIMHEEVKLKILHKAVGGVNESDVSLASASGAMILAFNVRSGPQASTLASREGVRISYYSIIYDLINDVKALLSGMLAPNIREVWLGNVDRKSTRLNSSH